MSDERGTTQDARTAREEADDAGVSTRRRFLRGALLGGAGLVAAGCGRGKQAAPPTPPAKPPVPTPPATPPTPAAPTLPDGLSEAFFHLHTRRPLTLEAKRSSMGVAAITPLSRFFVRNNLPMPSQDIVADPDAWVLDVKGVKKPRAITVAELKQLGMETITTVIQCSGNGRKFYKHGPSGSQWATGASGCAMWTGVPVRTLVAALGGLADGVKFMTSTGGESLPAGVDPLNVIVERSILKEKGMQDCLLAWEMNGQPIPITHGGPLRLIVPGFYGCNQIKYIKQLAFTAEQTQAKIQRSGYRLRPIGEKGAPDQPSMWQMNVKSWVNGPGADGQPVLAGDVHFHGVAFSGGDAVARVEVSLDNGATWQEAAWTGPDLGPYAWRAFAFKKPLTPGTYTIYSRATLASGAAQPEQRVENERGYGNNAWRDHGLSVTVVAELPKKKPAATTTTPGTTPAATTPAQRAQLSEQGARGREVFMSDASPSCTACHTLADAGSSGAVGPNLNQLAPDAARVKAAVTNGVGSMPPYRDTLKPGQIEDVARYVMEATKKKP